MTERFRTIVADPPWAYPGGFGIGRVPKGETNDGRRRPLDYSAMSVAEIAALPVRSLANPDGCHLYLWTTNRYLHDAFHVVEAWGFRYAQTLIWTKKPIGSFLGGAFNATAEFVLFARMGKLRHLERQVSQWFAWPRAGQGGHSKKPDAFLDMVERVSPGPRLELFARRARFGWDYWGDESLQTVELPEVAA